MAELLKGAPVARALTEELAARCVALRERGVVPTLAIVRVGEREDDLSYERGALKRCEKVGIEARRVLLPADVSQDELLAAIEDIDTDSSVHGCLMFRPLPAGLDEDAVAAALDPAKDVDSMTPTSLLTTLSGRGEGFAPCTAEAVLALLDHYGVELDGAKVAVVGRSLVIGRPVAAMLTARNATVTTCHTHTLPSAVLPTLWLPPLDARVRLTWMRFERARRSLMLALIGTRPLASWWVTSILMLRSRSLTPSRPCRAAWAL